MKRIVTLTESELTRIIKRILMEQDSVTAPSTTTTTTLPTNTTIKAEVYSSRLDKGYGQGPSSPFTYIDINTSSIKLDDSTTLKDNTGFDFDFNMAGTSPLLKGRYECSKSGVIKVDKIPMEVINLGQRGKLYMDPYALGFNHMELIKFSSSGEIPSDVFFHLSSENKQKMNSYCKNLKRVDLEDYSSTNNTKTQQMTERDLSRIVKRTIMGF